MGEKTTKGVFKCQALHVNDGVQHVILRPVRAGEDDGWDEFGMATPGGEVKLQVDEERCNTDFFEPGEHYELEFSPANR